MRSSRVVVLASLGSLASCLTRPVTSSDPSTTQVVEALAANAAIDKVDLLFVIDNSSSMFDKQQYMAEAVPDLVDRFVNPRCVDPAHPRTEVGPSVHGVCATGRLEFP